MTRTVMVIAAFCLLTPALSAAQDARKGERVFRQCSSCHALEVGDNRVGPHLANILGRSAGSVEGFKYSDAMASSGWIWDAETLTAFLEDPRGSLPGNRMSYRGLRKPTDGEDLIAYLETLQGE